MAEKATEKVSSNQNVDQQLSRSSFFILFSLDRLLSPLLYSVIIHFLI